MNMTVWHGGWHSIGGRLGRLALIALGIVVGQVVLYGPSLVGSKVLLPLDLLAQPGTYLPLKPGQAPPIPHNFVRMDLIHIGEPARQFIAPPPSRSIATLQVPFTEDVSMEEFLAGMKLHK